MTLGRIILSAVNKYVEFEVTGTTHMVYYKTVGTNNLILNGDGPNTTDWIDGDSDGLADYWLKSGSYTSCNIINSVSGFTDNAQRFYANTITTADQIYIYEDSYFLEQNRKYIISFNYRSNIGIKLTDNIGNELTSVVANDSGVASVNTTITPAQKCVLFFRLSGVAAVNDWAIIDKVSLI